MKSDTVVKLSVGFFVLIFFAYLFGPLILMGLTAFNSSQFPRVSPWECFSVEWFDVLMNDKTLMTGLRNSLFIGLGVVCLAVPLGLAGALMLTQVTPRVRPWYYTIIISPILVPGVVLGISTLLFWDRLGKMFGFSQESIFYDGFFLTVIGQSTFIAAYAMLVFISRLQRFDTAQEEAALDLGATHVQTFRKILLPFLKPAIASAAVLAFLASFENYNTTIFTIVSESTLTTVLASKVRYGINPSISALAVVIVTLTLLAAAVFEVLKRREEKVAKESELIARGELQSHTKRAKAWLDPAMIMVILIFIAGLGTTYFAGTIGLEECKVRVKEEKQRIIQEKVRKRQQLDMFGGAAPKEKTEQVRPQEKTRAKGTEGYEGIFDPGNLGGESKKEEPEEKTKAKGTEGYQGIFDPNNLQGQSGTDAGQQ